MFPLWFVLLGGSFFVFLDVGLSILFLVFPLIFFGWVLWFIYDCQGFIISSLYIQYFCKRPISNGTNFDGFYLFIFLVPPPPNFVMLQTTQVFLKKWNYGEILQLGDYYLFFSESEKIMNFWVIFREFF